MLSRIYILSCFLVLVGSVNARAASWESSRRMRCAASVSGVAVALFITGRLILEDPTIGPDSTPGSGSALEALPNLRSQSKDVPDVTPLSHQVSSAEVHAEPAATLNSTEREPLKWNSLIEDPEAFSASSPELQESLLERVRFYKQLPSDSAEMKDSSRRFKRLLEALRDLEILTRVNPNESEIKVTREDLEDDPAAEPKADAKEITMKFSDPYGLHQWAFTQIGHSISKMVHPVERRGVESNIAPLVREALHGYFEALQSGGDIQVWEDRILDFWATEAAEQSDLSLPENLRFEVVTDADTGKRIAIIRTLALKSEIMRDGQILRIDTSTLELTETSATVKDPRNGHRLALTEDDLKFAFVYELTED